MTNWCNILQLKGQQSKLLQAILGAIVEFDKMLAMFRLVLWVLLLFLIIVLLNYN